MKKLISGVKVNIDSMKYQHNTTLHTIREMRCECCLSFVFEFFLLLNQHISTNNKEKRMKCKGR